MVHFGYRDLNFHDPCYVLLTGATLKALFAEGGLNVLLALIMHVKRITYMFNGAYVVLLNQ